MTYFLCFFSFICMFLPLWPAQFLLNLYTLNISRWIYFYLLFFFFNIYIQQYYLQQALIVFVVIVLYVYVNNFSSSFIFLLNVMCYMLKHLMASVSNSSQRAICVYWLKCYLLNCTRVIRSTCLVKKIALNLQQ